ncbi:MAG TPA: hypothetical protein VGD66_10745 [Allosphingosinicella sp.]
MVERERERVVVAESRRGGGGTAVVAVIAIIALLVVLYLVFGQGLMHGTATKKINADVKIDAPIGNSG